jgi:hypothetical protein
MADDKSKRDGRDRSRVAASQPHEVAYVAKRTGAKRADVKKAAEQAGPNRKKVEAAIKKG